MIEATAITAATLSSEGSASTRFSGSRMGRIGGIHVTQLRAGVDAFWGSRCRHVERGHHALTVVVRNGQRKLLGVEALRAEVRIIDCLLMAKDRRATRAVRDGELDVAVELLRERVRAARVGAVGLTVT